MQTLRPRGVTRSLSATFGAMALLWQAPPAHALNEAGAQVVIARFIGSQKPADAQPAAGHHAITDLDGDGRADLVLQWDELGPTWSRPKLSVFIDQGRNYRTLTTDLSGQVQGLQVQGATIVVNTLMPGPKDPRCCPSLKKQLVFRWVGGKLMGER